MFVIARHGIRNMLFIARHEYITLLFLHVTSWKAFWKFVVELHPSLNQRDITIVTDQDKGLEKAIEEEVNQVINFHCSFHRSQNIIKMCGTKSGTRVYSALWVYNRLLQCRTVAQLDKAQ